MAFLVEKPRHGKTAARTGEGSQGPPYKRGAQAALQAGARGPMAFLAEKPTRDVAVARAREGGGTPTGVPRWAKRF